jgi:hypothetical protein
MASRGIRYLFSYLLKADAFYDIVAYFFSCFYSIPQVAQRMRLSGNAVFCSLLLYNVHQLLG